MNFKIILSIGLFLIILLLIVSFVGYMPLEGRYRREIASELKRTIISDSLIAEADIQHLPDPVKRYLRYAGVMHKRKVENFKVSFIGRLRKDSASGWMDFSSTQYNFMDIPTRLFYMKAKMKGLPVKGFHCYKDGVAFMDIRLFSLFKVQYQSGKEMNIAETVTFFNDMCCMAPATLIDKRIKWEEVNNYTVKAYFTHKNISISAILYFNDKGELINFVSEDRYALMKDNTMKRLRWSTPLKNYKEINGYRLPGYAEAIYTYPDGDFCYGTFSLNDIHYNCNSNE